jgi:hypothetical protein
MKPRDARARSSGQTPDILRGIHRHEQLNNALPPARPVRPSTASPSISTRLRRSALDFARRAENPIRSAPPSGWESFLNATSPDERAHRRSPLDMLGISRSEDSADHSLENFARIAITIPLAAGTSTDVPQLLTHSTQLWRISPDNRRLAPAARAHLDLENHVGFARRPRYVPRSAAQAHHHAV